MKKDHSSAESLRDFLVCKGWLPLEAALEDKLFALNHPDYTRRQLIFPVDKQAPDFKEAVTLVFSKLSEILGERPEAISAEYSAFVVNRLLENELPASYYVGSVEQLLGQIDCSGARSGVVVLALLKKGRATPVLVRVSLNAQHYKDAVAAHLSGDAYLRLFGQLSVSGNQLQLTKVREVTVLGTRPCLAKKLRKIG